LPKSFAFFFPNIFILLLFIVAILSA